MGSGWLAGACMLTPLATETVNSEVTIMCIFVRLCLCRQEHYFLFLMCNTCLQRVNFAGKSNISLFIFTVAFKDFTQTWRVNFAGIKISFTHHCPCILSGDLPRPGGGLQCLQYLSWLQCQHTWTPSLAPSEPWTWQSWGFLLWVRSSKDHL